MNHTTTLDPDAEAAFEAHVRATLRAVADATPTDDGTVMLRRPIGRPRVLMWAAAVSCIAIGSAALVVHDGDGDSPTTADAPGAIPVPPALVPWELPPGWTLYSGSRSDAITSDSGGPFVPWAQQVYAPAIALDDASSFIGVTVDDFPFCVTDGPAATTVDAPSVCTDSYATTMVAWSDDGSFVNVVGGPSLDEQTVRDFATAWNADRAAPPGWQLVSDNTALIAAGGHQVLYTLGPTDPSPGLRYVEVRIWTGVPASAVYAIGFPLTTQPVTIGTADGLIDTKEPLNVFVSWADPSGAVIQVQAYMGTRELALQIAESLHHVDASAWAEFLTTSHDAPFALPRDEQP